MKKSIYAICLAISSILSFFGTNIKNSNAEILQHSDFINIKENTPLYLELFSNGIYQEEKNNILLADHYSHYSHGSHGSHGSHHSHYSG